VIALPNRQEKLLESLLYGLAVVACPVGMVVMMWMMARGRRGGSPSSHNSSDQVDGLRSEIEQLKAERAAQRGEGGGL
jgi:hypothetical protein